MSRFRLGHLGVAAGIGAGCVYAILMIVLWLSVVGGAILGFVWLWRQVMG